MKGAPRIETAGPALYPGTVVHVRYRPVRHKLRYGVFCLLLDVEKLNHAADKTRLFSVNRAGLLSFHEKDHGRGEALLPFLRGIARDAGFADQVTGFHILCYPRVFGYVFNPITTYYGTNANGEVVLMIYEVRNTFGEMLTYVLPVAEGQGDRIAQSCAKQFYVSPFNDVEGNYDFALTPPGDTVTLGVTLNTDGEKLLSASFHGQRQSLTDANIIKALLRTGWLTIGVVLGIHVEAAKLWLKGLRMKRKPPAPDDNVRFGKSSAREKRKAA